MALCPRKRCVLHLAHTTRKRHGLDARRSSFTAHRVEDTGTAAVGMRPGRSKDESSVVRGFKGDALSRRLQGRELANTYVGRS